MSINAIPDIIEVCVNTLIKFELPLQGEAGMLVSCEGNVMREMGMWGN